MIWRDFWLRCSCGDAEHSVLLSYDPTDPDDWLYVQPHLEPTNFWNRLKYLFGARSRIGAFTELVLTDEGVAELEEYLSSFRNRDSDAAAIAAPCGDMAVPQDQQARAESIAQKQSPKTHSGGQINDE